MAQRIGRSPSETIDALNRSMARDDHHDWVKDAADRLILGADILWQAMCASWATRCASRWDLERVTQPIQDALGG